MPQAAGLILRGSSTMTLGFDQQSFSRTTADMFFYCSRSAGSRLYKCYIELNQAISTLRFFPPGAGPTHLRQIPIVKGRSIFLFLELCYPHYAATRRKPRHEGWQKLRADQGRPLARIPPRTILSLHEPSIYLRSRNHFPLPILDGGRCRCREKILGCRW